MLPENKNPPGPFGSEDTVYYVENVDGDDFTFYLNAEGNKDLLQKEGFSYSRQLTVVRISPLLKGGNVKDRPKLLERLNELLKGDAGALEEPLRGFRGRVGAPFSEEDLKVLPPKVISALNAWIRDDDAPAPEGVGGFDGGEEQETLRRLSKDSQRACLKRKHVDGVFKGCLKPFRLSPAEGRAIVSRAYRGELLSVTFRVKKSSTSYKPGTSTSEEYPISMKRYCSELCRAIAAVKEMRGLLVVTGATNSAKSEIATGLIYKYLQWWKRGHRGKGRPHLVTFEDPVEKFYARTPEGVPPGHLSVETEAAAERGVDYTPRERGHAGEHGKDVESLREALADALRQTPTVFFVGETREKAYWRQLIDFAGTGHLLVTTAHAGSLSEAMHKIFEALRVRTPAERSEIANRLLAVVHIRRHPKILVPALWRRTPTGRNALTAEGLSSLLPYTPDEGDDVTGCLGRFWFAQRLTARNKRLSSAEAADDVEDILRSAVAWDLEGV